MQIGFVCGAFDLCHAGHIALFREAKQNCDYLIVGLHVDPSHERVRKHKPIETVSERMIKLNAIKFIDEIIPYETEDELKELTRILQPDIRFLDEDYKNKPITDLDIPIHWIKRQHHQSSTNLRRRMQDPSDGANTA